MDGLSNDLAIDAFQDTLHTASVSPSNLHVPSLATIWANSCDWLPDPFENQPDAISEIKSHPHRYFKGFKPVWTEGYEDWIISLKRGDDPNCPDWMPKDVRDQVIGVLCRVCREACAELPPEQFRKELSKTNGGCFVSRPCTNRKYAIKILWKHEFGTYENSPKQADFPDKRRLRLKFLNTVGESYRCTIHMGYYLKRHEERCKKMDSKILNNSNDNNNYLLSEILIFKPNGTNDLVKDPEMLVCDRNKTNNRVKETKHLYSQIEDGASNYNDIAAKQSPNRKFSFVSEASRSASDSTEIANEVSPSNLGYHDNFNYDNFNREFQSIQQTNATEANSLLGNSYTQIADFSFISSDSENILDDSDRMETMSCGTESQPSHNSDSDCSD